VNFSVQEVFPGLDEELSKHRLKRVETALSSLFTQAIKYTDDGLPFVITGDIPAMWLRDSTWQVKPLFNSHNPKIIDFLVNLSKAQIKFFLIDPYANAFNPTPNNNCWHKDFENQSPWVFERKFELDSWAAVLYLARKIFETYGVIEHLDEDFLNAFNLMTKLAIREQNHDRESYIFKRSMSPANDYLSHDGRGAPTAYTGMIYSAFRPSDDACKYGFLVPSNIFFCSELRKLPSKVANSFSISLADQIEEGITKHAIKNGAFMYEVDGLGNFEMMDDANTPSLISLPYLEAIPSNDETYKATRALVLSKKNPFYYSGKWAEGIGSSHTPEGHVWPLSIAMAALTTSDKEFQLKTLSILENSDAGTGNLHESFNVNDPNKYTREWFSWSDMTYVDLVLTAHMPAKKYTKRN